MKRTFAILLCLIALSSWSDQTPLVEDSNGVRKLADGAETLSVPGSIEASSGSGDVYFDLKSLSASYKPALRLFQSATEKWRIYSPAGSNDLRFWDATGSIDAFTFNSGGTFNAAANVVSGADLLSFSDVYFADRLYSDWGGSNFLIADENGRVYGRTYSELAQLNFVNYSTGGEIRPSASGVKPRIAIAGAYVENDFYSATSNNVYWRFFRATNTGSNSAIILINEPDGTNNPMFILDAKNKTIWHEGTVDIDSWVNIDGDATIDQGLAVGNSSNTLTRYIPLYSAAISGGGASWSYGSGYIVADATSGAITLRWGLDVAVGTDLKAVAVRFYNDSVGDVTNGVYLKKATDGTPTTVATYENTTSSETVTHTATAGTAETVVSGTTYWLEFYGNTGGDYQIYDVWYITEKREL